MVEAKAIKKKKSGCTSCIYAFWKKKKKERDRKRESVIYIFELAYMLYENIVLDLQPRSEEFGATLKPKGSRVTY
jgi:hypothetical protein